MKKFEWYACLFAFYVIAMFTVFSALLVLTFMFVSQLAGLVPDAGILVVTACCIGAVITCMVVLAHAHG